MIGPTLQIARIAGIPIRVDVSWLLIFLLFVYLVIRNFFAPLFPDVGLGGRIGLAVLTILLLFLSVLLHELAHSLVARAAGLEVKAIALFILGGVSQLEGEPRRPWVEFWMALSGPLVSLLLGVLCGGLALLFGAGELARAILEERVARVPAAGAVLFWLTLQNLLLFGFNMLPGFPLDGGRVVRALIWALSGSYHQATRIAVWLGLGLGALFVLAGGALLLKEGTGGVWLLLVGLYLLLSAWAGMRQAALQERLRALELDQEMEQPMDQAPPPNLLPPDAAAPVPPPSLLSHASGPLPTPPAESNTP